MTRLDAPTMDPSGTSGWARSRFVLHRVYEGGTRSLEKMPHGLPLGEHALGRLAAEPGVVSIPDDALASRTHARLLVSREGVRVVDASKHGTFVNGARIKEAPLLDGDVLRAGDSIFVLRVEPETLDDAKVPELAGTSVEVSVLRATLAQVGPSRASALLLGETGAGKEVAARALHRLSGRPGAFVPVNCSAIPGTLFESELFGHTKGAFTGAERDDEGLVRAAAGGTLFLDEIGELPLEMQPKLLRFLDEGAVLAVGARKPVAVDVRVIAATHQDLARAVTNARFRGDLYARLAELVVPLPPLRTRRDDVLLLLSRALASHSCATPLAGDLAHALTLHGWPFNVREVQKIASELAVRGRDRPILELKLVAARLGPPGAGGGETLRHAHQDGDHDDGDDHDDDAPSAPAPDRPALERLLTEARGSVSEVARVTGRSRRQVRRWLEKYKLVADAFRT